MEGVSTGTGFAAMGFWLFIAAIIISGVWDSIRKRDAQHETLRRMIESGQPIDDAMADKLFSLAKTGNNKDTGRDMQAGGWICLVLGPGLAIFGYIMGIFLAPELISIMFAVGVLMLFISAGLFIAARKVYGYKSSQEGR